MRLIKRTVQLALCTLFLYACARALIVRDESTALPEREANAPRAEAIVVPARTDAVPPDGLCDLPAYPAAAVAFDCCRPVAARAPRQSRVPYRTAQYFAFHLEGEAG